MTRFEIQDLVSQNQDGVTFRALDKSSNQIVSLRRFFPFGQCDEDEEGGEGLDPQEGKAFSSACVRLSRVNHPALRRTIFGDTDPVDGMPFLVTEWLEGESLADVLGNNTMEPSMIIGLVRQALDVCIILSKTLKNEAVWIDTKLEAIIVSNPVEKPTFSFRICPFKWLGTQSHQKDLTDIVSMVEALMGWKSKLVSDHAGLGLGGWLKSLRHNPQMPLAHALKTLPSPNTKPVTETTAGISNIPVQQPYILPSANPTIFTKTSVTIMAVSAILTGALILFLYQQNVRKSDSTTPATVVPQPEILGSSPTSERITPIIETPTPTKETTSPSTVTTPLKTTSWSPIKIPIAAWYDASHTATITSINGFVSQWNDISGNNGHATQSTSDLQPKTGTRTINDLNAIDFDVDKLGRAEINLNGKAIFAVLSLDEGGDGGLIISHSNINNQLRTHGRGQVGYAAIPARYKDFRPSTERLTMNKPGMVGFIFDTTLQYSVNGVFDDTGASESQSIGAVFNQFGAREEDAVALDGMVGEIVITESIPDTGTRQKIEGYLAHKWRIAENLPADHPYKLSAPPLSESAVEPPKSPPTTEPNKPKTRLWAPNEITTIAWYDAADITTLLSEDGLVYQWKDKSGNNNHATQSAEYFQPTTGKRKINGLNVLDFSTDKLSIKNIDMEGKAMFAVIQRDTIGFSQILSNDNINVQLRLNTEEKLEYAASPPLYPGNTSSTNAFKLNTPGIAAYLLDTTMQYSANGTFQNTGISTGNGNSVFNQIGMRAGANDEWDGLMGEIIITSTVPDTDTRHKIEGYLAHKWSLVASLPADHPYKLSAPPLSESAVEPPKSPPTTEPNKSKTRSWSPNEISTIAWYDAVDEATITANNGAVSLFKDKSKGANDLSQGTTNKQPKTGTRTIGGLNVLDFDGLDDELLDADFSALNTADISIFAVQKYDETNIQSMTAWTLARNTNTEGMLFHSSFGSQFSIGYRLPQHASLFYTENTNVELLSYVKSGKSSQQAWVNGVMTGHETNSVTDFTAQRLALGSRNMANYLQGSIGEFIIVPSALADADRHKIEGYLAHKWSLVASLPADHPYKLSAPIPSILTSKDTEIIKTLKVGDPVTLQGIVRSAKFSTTGKSIYLSFSDPDVETDIRVVIHGNEYVGNAFTEEEFAKLIGKNLVFSGTVYTESFNDRPPFVKITDKQQIRKATQTE